MPGIDLRAEVGAVSAGGVLGAEARYGLTVLLPHDGSQFPWSTLLINLTGSMLIGVLMGTVLVMRAPHRLLRPFLGVGVLGGYTTYSSFAVDVQRLLAGHRPLLALGYLVSTVLGCAGVVWLATVTTVSTGRTMLAGSAAARELAVEPLPEGPEFEAEWEAR